MFWRSFTNNSSILLILHLLTVGSYFQFCMTTSVSNHSAVKIAFILEQGQSKVFNSAYGVFLKESLMDSSLHNVEGITLEWRVKDTPYSVWKKIEQNVIVKNVSLVLSFLPSRKNQILVDALGKSIVPIIGLQSLREEVYSKHQVRYSSSPLQIKSTPEFAYKMFQITPVDT